MGSSSYGAAQPIIDVFRRIPRAADDLTAGHYIDAGRDILGMQHPDQGPSQPVDTSWHDQMVREANESFRRQAERDNAANAANAAKASKPAGKLYRRK